MLRVLLAYSQYSLEKHTLEKHPSMLVSTIISYLETIAPPGYQESYDNARLITGSPDWTVTGVLTTLDCIEATVEEAVAEGCNLIVAHHPIVFKGLKSLTGSDYVERTVIKAIKAEVAIYAIHTNLDNVLEYGVNQRIGQRLGLQDMEILAPKPGMEPHIGSGLVGNLSAPMSEDDFLRYLRYQMQTPLVRHTRLLGKPVQRVALCGGAGSFLLPQARRAGADVFVTADYKYHEFFDADGQLIIADIGHYESEQFTIDLLAELISEKFRNFAVRCTKVATNPVQYLF